jgi:predicted lipoprotein with Yx(FWY)xxD motif
MQKSDVSLIVTLVVLVLVIGGVSVILMPKGGDNFTSAESMVIPKSQFTGVIKSMIALDGKEYITDSKGMTLYFSTKDSVGTIDRPPKSNCTTGCQESWSPYFSKKIMVSKRLNSADFGSFLREDGKKQTAYKGWPLYYYYKDVKPGDMLGEGLENVWFSAKPNL